MTKLLATSVVRGSEQGQSHGGLFLIDLETQQIEQKLDWNTIDIDWQGAVGTAAYAVWQSIKRPFMWWQVMSYLPMTPILSKSGVGKTLI